MAHELGSERRLTALVCSNANLVLAYIGKAFRELNWLSMVMPREDLFIVETLMVTTLSWFTKKKKRISLWVQPSGAKVWTRSIHSIKNKETFKNE